jgi:hypothetical protein
VLPRQGKQKGVELEKNPAPFTQVEAHTPVPDIQGTHNPAVLN